MIAGLAFAGVVAKAQTVDFVFHDNQQDPEVNRVLRGPAQKIMDACRPKMENYLNQYRALQRYNRGYAPADVDRVVFSTYMDLRSAVQAAAMPIAFPGNTGNPRDNAIYIQNSRNNVLRHIEEWRISGPPKPETYGPGVAAQANYRQALESYSINGLFYDAQLCIWDMSISLPPVTVGSGAPSSASQSRQGLGSAGESASQPSAPRTTSPAREMNAPSQNRNGGRNEGRDNSQVEGVGRANSLSLSAGRKEPAPTIAEMANQCVGLRGGETLYGGFTNSCGYPIAVAWCAYHPAKNAWSEAFDCDSGKGPRGGLATVAAKADEASHTHNAEKIFWFACRRPAYPRVTYQSGIGFFGHCE